MVKPVGGRGKKAPYETTFVRVPIPIKGEVENLVAQYRKQVLEGGETLEDSTQTEIYQSCLKLVNKFVDESGQADKLHTRNNVNLVRLQNWLQSKIDGE